jgi:hypothetical protein
MNGKTVAINKVLSRFYPRKDLNRRGLFRRLLPRVVRFALPLVFAVRAARPDNHDEICS